MLLTSGATSASLKPRVSFNVSNNLIVDKMTTSAIVSEGTFVNQSN